MNQTEIFFAACIAVGVFSTAFASFVFAWSNACWRKTKQKQFVPETLNPEDFCD